MRKFNIGDTVGIKEDLIVGKCYGDGYEFQSEMKEYAGEKAVILEGLPYSGYLLNIDNCKYCWSDEMFQDTKFVTITKKEYDKLKRIAEYNGYI